MVGPGLHVHAREGVHHQGHGGCLARGFDRTGFFEVDTAEQPSWTVQLTEPAELAPKNAPAVPHSDSADACRHRPAATGPTTTAPKSKN